MILPFTRNIKLLATVYGAICFIAYFLLAGVSWVVLSDTLSTKQLWTVMICLGVLFTGAAGYVAAHYIQRRMDPLHLGIIQLMKGNYAYRLDLDNTELFKQIMEDYNQMTTVLEERMKQVQHRGVHEAMQQEAAEKAVIEERRRLARDLHDTVSQHLFAMHMQASSLPTLMKRNPEQSEKILNQLIQLSSLAQKQIRGLIAQLRPLELEGKSLTEGLGIWFPDYCNHNGLQGTLDVELEQDVPEVIEQQIFLIVQEAMANVVKHASARKVKVGVFETHSQYNVHITDDGVGFKQSMNHQHSYGLSTMRERARKMGGDLIVTSRIGSGTRVQVQIPKFHEEYGGNGGQT